MQKGYLTKAEYKSIFKRVPRICVDLIVTGKAGILLTKRLIAPYKNSWHLPGGRVYFRESLTKAVKRIAKKELSLNQVVISPLVGYMEFVREVQDKNPMHSISLVFEIKSKSDNYKGSWQGKDIRFFKHLPADIHPVHGIFLKKEGYFN